MGREAGKDDSAIEFIRVTSEAAVYETLVRVASDHLPADLCKVATVDGDELVPRARSDDQPVDLDQSLALNGNPIGDTVTTGRSNIVDDIQFTRSTATSGETDQPRDLSQPRALVVVPLGEDGVLIGMALEPGVFTPSDRETGERLVSYADAALDRIDRTSEPLQDRFNEFGAVVAHDLRGPLGVARAYTSHVQETGERENLNAVVQALDRMDELISDLQDLVEAGRRIGALEDVSVAEVASQCWRTVAAGRGSLAIESDIEMRADQSQLRHLFENLFQNAINYGGEKVTVTVGPLADGFYIEDTGPGIPPNLEGDLFDAGVTTSDSGSGYGLAIVKQIVDAHGWTITVPSSAKGGARFEITDVTVAD